jgi:hypothetical protein
MTVNWVFFGTEHLNKVIRPNITTIKVSIFECLAEAGSIETSFAAATILLAGDAEFEAQRNEKLRSGPGHDRSTTKSCRNLTVSKGPIPTVLVTRGGAMHKFRVATKLPCARYSTCRPIKLIGPLASRRTEVLTTCAKKHFTV